MEFIAATNNRNKLEELGRLLKPAGHTLLSMADAGVSVMVDEDGATFAENAAKKALAVCRASGKPALADDSGLCVDALGGDPGVRSARLAGPAASDEDNNKRLLFLLERTPYAKRKAHFTSVLVLAMPDGRTLEAEGSVHGQIGFDANGDNGFGYDPLFYIQNRSFAEMSDEEKDTVSHRAAAVKDFLRKLPGFLGGGGA